MRAVRSYFAPRPLLCLALAIFVTIVVAGDGESFGEGLTGSETIPITELMADADDYVDKVVRVEGVITNVCQKAGCWMTIAPEGESAEEIRVKVNDGVIVFPTDGKGRHAIAEGVFIKIEMTLDETVGWLEHQAEEQGEPFDAASVTEPMTFYQIKGTGAVIR